MNKIISIFISCLMFGCANDDKDKSISEIYNACYAKNVTVKGKSIKHYLKGFERVLIKNKFLKDSTGKSYNDLFHELSDYEYIDLKTNYSFADSVKGVKYNDLLNCPLKIKDHPDFENSIFGKLVDYMKENGGNHEGFFKSQPIDSIFNEKTFEFDYIKHKMFDAIRVYDDGKNQTGKVLYKLENYPERVELRIDSDNRVFWQNELMDIRGLSGKAFAYFSDYDNEKIIFFETSPEADISTYIRANNELISAKNRFLEQVSKRVYNKNYDGLSDKEQQKINKAYKFRVREFSNNPLGNRLRSL